MKNSLIVLFISFLVLLVSFLFAFWSPIVTNDDEPGVYFEYALSGDEYEQFLLSLAGEDPDRIAAISSWLAIDDVDIFDHDEGQVVELQFANSELKLEHVEPLELFPEISRITFDQCNLSNEMVRLLSKQHNLEQLIVSDAKGVGNLLLATAGKLPRLDTLSIFNCDANDECISSLANLKELRELYLGNNAVTSAIGPHLSNLPKLRRVNLAGTKIDDACLRDLSKISTLTSLGLGRTKISERGLSYLVGLDLKSVGLQETKIGDKACGIIVRFPCLYSLHLDGTNITNEGVSKLESLKKLGDLSLRNTRIDDGCVEVLLKMKQIRSLDILGTRISEQGALRIQANYQYDTQNDFGIIKTNKQH